MGKMELTAAAKRWCKEMSAYYPREIDEWKRRAAVIARAQKKRQIGKSDLEAAMMVAGDEFLPCEEDKSTQH